MWEASFGAEECNTEPFIWSSLRRVISGEAPYEVYVDESTCAGGGQGVYIDGRAEAGEVLAVYRGVVFDPESVESMHAFICPDNSYLLFRRDTVLLDGCTTGPSGRIFETCLLREAASAGIEPAEAWERVNANKFAVGQLINHPPAGFSPNVRATAINVGCEGDHVLGILGPAPQETLEWLQWNNLKFKPPDNVEDSQTMKSVVLRAARTVEDEELFLDYKISAELRGDQLPFWYCPVVSCPFNDMGVATPPRMLQHQ